ncbi:MAG: RrF2 family transcriptional regulator [Planctomycetota bacterium]|jgi:Rrf2 family protein
MLTETSIAGVRTLVHLVLDDPAKPIPPRQIAEDLGLSPSYLAKTANQLVKAGILRSQRGAHGGVTLSRAPEDITLLEIVEACQGKILGSFCEPTGQLSRVCAFHKAMVEAHDCLLGTLSRWSLADLAEEPGPAPSLAKAVKCRMLDFS